MPDWVCEEKAFNRDWQLDTNKPKGERKKYTLTFCKRRSASTREVMLLVVVIVLLLLLMHQHQRMFASKYVAVCASVLQGYSEESVEVSDMIYGSSQIGSTVCLCVCLLWRVMCCLPAMADGKSDHPSTVFIWRLKCRHTVQRQSVKPVKVVWGGNGSAGGDDARPFSNRDCTLTLCASSCAIVKLQNALKH